MKMSIFKIFLTGAAVLLYLINSAGIIMGQCGLPGTPPCEASSNINLKKTAIKPKVTSSKSKAGNSNKSSLKSRAKNIRTVAGNNEINYLNIIDECTNVDCEITAYTKFITQHPNDNWVYFLRGMSYFEKRDFNNAISDFSKRLTSKENSVYLKSVYLLRAESYQRLGNYEEANKDYNKFIEIDPKSNDAYINRAQVYYELGKYDEAIEDFTKAIVLSSYFNYKVYNSRGLTYLKKGDLHNAFNDFEKVISIVSYFPEAYNNLAYIHQIAGNYDQAINNYTKALNIRLKYPQNPTPQDASFSIANTYKYRGDVYQLKSDSDSAKKDYEKAIENYTKSIALLEKSSEGRFSFNQNLLSDNYKNRAIAYRLLGKTNLAEADEKMSGESK